jgi:hypothetical protein
MRCEIEAQAAAPEPLVVADHEDALAAWLSRRGIVCEWLIAGLVAAIKSYSQMDRASMQHIDVTDGLDSTRLMLGRKLGDGMTVIHDYSANVPRIEAYAGELNQVWTNFIDNAVDAMAGAGRSGGDAGRGGPCRHRGRRHRPGDATAGGRRAFEAFTPPRTWAKAPVSDSTPPNASS